MNNKDKELLLASIENHRKQASSSSLNQLNLIKAFYQGYEEALRDVEARIKYLK